MSFVYAFDHRHEAAPTELKHLLGGKGADLAEMTSVLGLPVPPGFTITTEACRAYLSEGTWPAGLDDEIGRHLDGLEAKMGRRLGDPSDPLLVSVRSGAALSMPGMMDTVLNLGLNDDSVEGLAKQTGDDRFAYDSYRRFIAMFGRIVLGLDGAALRRTARRRPQPRGRLVRQRDPGRVAALPHDHVPALRCDGDRAARSRRTRPSRCGWRSARCSRRGPGHVRSRTAIVSTSLTISAPR